MRQKRDKQMDFQQLKPNWFRTRKAKELAQIDQILSAHPQLCDGVARDLASPKRSKRGAKGMTAEQVLRVAVIKQLRQYDYRELQDAIDDSERLRAFCRMGDREVPSFSTLQQNVVRISPATWEQINRVLVQYAKQAKIENGRKVRIDTTAIETDIHHPTDSHLLWDCIRVATRHMKAARECFGDRIADFNDRTRAAKKRWFKISNTKSKAQRHTLYRELIRLGQQVYDQAVQVRDSLAQLRPTSFQDQLLAQAAQEALDEVLTHFPGVLSQTRRRILEGESVPASEKIVSIFEPHTDIIVKGSRQPTFGHKVCFTGGASNLILDCQIERGNPGDSGLFIPSLKAVSRVLGDCPRQVCSDDGFASQANAAEAQRLGVRDVVFGGKLEKEDQWVCSSWVQKQLRRFRSGIEASISAGKRAFGLDRCTWSGWRGFQCYVWSAVVAWNLQVLARHLLT